MKSCVTETITSIKSVTLLENPNCYNSYHSKLRWLKRRFPGVFFRLAVNVSGGFTANVVKFGSTANKCKKTAVYTGDNG